MYFTIVGAGGIGGVVGAHLARDGHTVKFIETRIEHVDAIRKSGLTVSGIADFIATPEVVHPADLSGSIGVVLVAVKGQDTNTALDAVCPYMSSDSYIVSLQNGLEVEKIAARIGSARSVGVEVTLGAYYAGPGKVVYSGRGDLAIGELDGTISERLGDLQRAFTCLLPTKISENILGMIWSKIALGAMWFATALVDEDVPMIFRHERYLPMFRRLATEVVQVARASGVRCEPVGGVDMAAFADRESPAHTVSQGWQVLIQSWTQYKSKRTGVWRDLAVLRRPTEVKSILDPVIQRGHKEEVGTPLLEELVSVISELEVGVREFGWKNLDDLRRRDGASVAEKG